MPLLELDDDPAALAARLLDEERTRIEDDAVTDVAALAIADEELPGVGDDELSFREVVRAGGASTVVVLGLLNLVDEFDRIAVAILGPDIQRTFGLNDTGLAFLGGVGALAVFSGAIVLGWLADRVRRTMLVGLTATMWAAFALLGGLTRTPVQLGATRVVNGLGKGNGPVVSSVLADRYPIGGRARVFAVHSLASPIGSLIGPLLVAGVAAAAGGTEGWRWSLVVLSVPALVLGLAAFFLPEPERGANEKDALGVQDEVAADPVPLGAAFARLRKIKTFAALMSALGALGLALSGAALIFNLLLEREYGLDGVGRGIVASVAALGGIVGVAVGARASDRLFRRDPGAVLRLVGVSLAAFGVIFVIGIHMPQVWMLVAFQVVGTAFVSAPLASCNAIIGAVTPFRMRGVAYAVVGVYLVLVGGLIGGVLTGMVSDAVGQRAALTIVIPPAMAGAGAYMWVASRYVKRDMALVVAELREEQSELARLASGEGADEILQVRDLDFSYGAVQVLFDVDLTVRRGETLALLGTNGAGKSTLLRAISGLALPDRGVVRFDGRTITYVEPTERVRRGIVQVPGGRAVFGSLTVRENLLAGAHTFVWDADRLERKATESLELFPALVPLLGQAAGTLSGGEQQMLALAKAMLLEPELLLIDELSLGLAPVAVQEILVAVDRLKERGITMVIVEQSINVALAVADRAVFMEKGRIRFEGATADLLERDDLVRAVFLGTEGG